MQDIIDFIKDNSGVLILCVGSITLILAIIRYLPKRPKLKIRGYTKYAGLNPTKIIANDNPENKDIDETRASREMLNTIILSLRNTSKKRAFNVRIKNLHKTMRVRKNLPEDFTIQPDDETTIELEYKKLVVGKYKDIKNPEFYNDIDITSDFSKIKSIIVISYENSKGKKYSVKYKISKR